MGARVGRNDSQGWEVSVTDVDLTLEGKKVFEGKDTLVSALNHRQDWAINVEQEYISNAQRHCL